MLIQCVSPIPFADIGTVAVSRPPVDRIDDLR